MAKAQKQYSIYQRKRRKGRPLMYVKFRGPDGNYLPGRSSGETSRSAAEVWALEELSKGEIPVSKKIRFGQYADGFFDWDGEYVTFLRNRGRKFGMLHASKMNAYLKNYLIPYFGHRLLSEINARDVEAWQDAMLKTRSVRTDEELSSASVNHMLVCLRTVMKRAVKDGLASSNPCSGVEKLASRPKQRGAISEAEAERVFRDIEEWDDPRHYWICRLSYLTGMRFGEVVALRWEDVEDGWISVRHSWGEKEGLKDPKTRKSKRRLPLATWIADELQKYRALLPEQLCGRFVFPTPNSEVPYHSQKATNDALYFMLAKADLQAADRVRRNIVFHSLRHTFNTRLRNRGVPDFLIQAYMGHSTPVMTDNYTDVGMVSFDAIVEAQRQKVGEPHI